MKTRINKRLLATAVCIMMCMTAVVRAQNDSLDGDYRASCQSTWTKYNNLTEANSIVRSNNIYRVAYIKENATHRHTFLVKRKGSSTETAFYTYFFLPHSPGVYGGSVVINDMRLYGDTCYFCGKEITTNKYEFRSYAIKD